MLCQCLPLLLSLLLPLLLMSLLPLALLLLSTITILLLPLLLLSLLLSLLMLYAQTVDILLFLLPLALLLLLLLLSTTMLLLSLVLLLLQLLAATTMLLLSLLMLSPFAMGSPLSTAAAACPPLTLTLTLTAVDIERLAPRDDVSPLALVGVLVQQDARAQQHPLAGVAGLRPAAGGPLLRNFRAHAQHGLSKLLECRVGGGGLRRFLWRGCGTRVDPTKIFRRSFFAEHKAW